MLKWPCCVLQRGLRNGLVEAVAAVAGGLSCTDPDLTAAPSDMPSTSDSGSHTHDITGEHSLSSLLLRPVV